MSAAVLELLLGAKVFDGAAWHIYDANNTELTNPAGVRGLGKMGALLMWPRAEQAIVLRRPSGFASITPATHHTSVLLLLECSVSATAGLRLGADSRIEVAPIIHAVAGLRIGAAVEAYVDPAVDAVSDVVDVVLEALLMAD